MDCSGVSDGAAAAIVVRAEDAHKYCKNPIYIKALSFVAGPAEGPLSQEYDFTTLPRSRRLRARCVRPGRHHQSARADQHGRSSRLLHADRTRALRRISASARAGHAWQDVMEGFFDLEGKLPINPDGGLKSFGHPIGASGLRMMYEMWLQMRGEAGPRQINIPKVGLTHNLGGQPRPMRQLRLGSRQPARLRYYSLCPSPVKSRERLGEGSAAQSQRPASRNAGRFSFPQLQCRTPRHYSNE